MIVLPDTKSFDSSIRLIQLVGGVTKVNMLKVCDKLDLYVSPNLKKVSMSLSRAVPTPVSFARCARPVQASETTFGCHLL